MESLVVKINNEKLVISKSVFKSLLDLSPIKESKEYENAIINNSVTFRELKKLSIKSGVPLPLFFANEEICEMQIFEKNKNLFSKIPSKNELKIASRGRVNISDIELIVKDLSRKQEFLKKRVLIDQPENTYIGRYEKAINSGVSLFIIANEIRSYFGFNLTYLRLLSKKDVLGYLRDCIERKGILVSFSSHNYMPQTLNSQLELSGICIKDKKIPYIFINTRDGDNTPKIIESEGRQIFTLLTMLVCVGINQFVLSSKSSLDNISSIKSAYKIASEIILPTKELKTLSIENINQLKDGCDLFKVTPSLLLYKLLESRIIKPEIAEQLWQKINSELRQDKKRVIRAPLPINGYSKYNGVRLSQEVVRAFNKGIISQLDVKNILFRNGRKMDKSLWQGYLKRYK